MHKVMICEGIISGANGTFLITIMIFEITGGELNLSIFRQGFRFLQFLRSFGLQNITTTTIELRFLELE